MGSQTCSARPSQPYIMMPPNLTSSAVTPRSVAPPFPPWGAGAAGVPGMGGAGVEGAPLDDLAAGEDGPPPAPPVVDLAESAPLAAPVEDFAGDGEPGVVPAGTGAPASPAGAAAGSAGAPSGVDCVASGAAAASWDWLDASGRAVLLLSLSEPPPHAPSMMAAAEARATILVLRICFTP